MGHNRAGDRVRARKRLHRREARRLEKVAVLAQAADTPAAEGLASKAKHLAQDVVAAVGGLVKKVVGKVKGESPPA